MCPDWMTGGLGSTISQLFGSFSFSCFIKHPPAVVFGKRVVFIHDEAKAALDACRQPLLDMRELIIGHPEKSDAEIREIYNAKAKNPPVREGVFRLMRAAILEGKM